MEHTCHNCGGKITVAVGESVSVREECPHCAADLHVCLNCRHYDTQAYNQCNEPQAERVLDKDKSNYCDYFKFADGSGHVTGKKPSKADYLKQLDNLFKSG